MQDRYTGDVGDFGKFGLLRRLGRQGDVRISVLWWRVPNESNGDGRFTRYLEDDGAGLRVCDPELFDHLRILVRENRRSVSSVETAGIFPLSTCFYADFVPQGSDSRDAWLRQAVALSSGCHLVFMDPDNGLECRSVPRTRLAARKYTYEVELLPFINSGSSILVYHHISRCGPAVEQVRLRLKALQALSPIGAVRAVIYRRGSARAFLLLAQPEHSAILERWGAFASDPNWRQHLESVDLE